MGALLIVSFVSAILLGLPTITYFYAREMGRNPKKWFLIGFFLPGIATIILSLLPDRSLENSDKPENSEAS
ncbi:hypothetical protein CNR22_10935 [Sphingobacteriaceae bacterium]|nr:hypothetical protein CNR22_10935 [Sphingobacteriaceae bacterium]